MPEQRFNRDAVLDAALEFVRERGYDALSARAIAKRAGCSVQPIYSLFGDMDGLMRDLYQHARAWVAEFNRTHGEDAPNPFAANGRAHLRLAQEEPALFTFLYLSPYMDFKSMDDLYRSVSQPGVEECIQTFGSLSAEAAHELYLNMIVYTHGLAVMLVGGASFDDFELSRRMDAAFYAFATAVGATHGVTSDACTASPDTGSTR